MGELIGGLLMVGIIIALYFLPAIAARGKKFYDGILLLNLFFGWTLIGWVGALIWAVCSPEKEKK